MGEISEREGQKAFYDRFLQALDPTKSMDDVLGENTDGVVNGNILEFKTSVSNLNAALFQCLKYLSAMRLKGKPVPANILIIDLVKEKVYLYESGPYLSEIQTVYVGAASKDNKNFTARTNPKILDYKSGELGEIELIEILKSNNFTKIDIDENCIVGWAEVFYRKCPEARKEDFIGHNEKNAHKTIGEIRKPVIFKNFINPYKGDTNIRFEYLMDRLNDRIQKKDLGAFYTPPFYAKKAQKLLMEAISRVPAGNDYVIIDRCAGTGNLEEGLDPEILSHCILSTYEYYEYKVLIEKFAGKARMIIPPSDADGTFNHGKVNGADALSEDYVKNEYINGFIKDDKCTIILYENPPFAETTSVEHQKQGKGKSSSGWKNSYVLQQMKKDLSARERSKVEEKATNELGNAFIWSAFKYYLRQPTDSYVVFSPAKYWKAHHLINKKFLDGYAFNRRWFHTKIDACIMCILWANEDTEIDKFTLKGFDIDPKTKELTGECEISVNRIHTRFSEIYYDKRKPEPVEDGILCGLDGLPKFEGVKRETPSYDPDNILGYMVVKGTGFDNPDLSASLLAGAKNDACGFWLYRDNYLSKLPMFAASRYITYNRAWTERGLIMKSGDGAERFNADVKSGKLKQFLLKCLLFTCLEMQNHMRNFTGSDGRLYTNELCLDTIKKDGQELLTQAGQDITGLVANEQEQKLLELWNNLLSCAKKTADYDSEMTYGVYQIHAEIDLKDEEFSRPGKTVWKNPEVHTAKIALKEALKIYYNKEIVPVLFEYEFLK